MDYLTKKTSNMGTKDRHKMTSYFFAVPNDPKILAPEPFHIIQLFCHDYI